MYQSYLLHFHYYYRLCIDVVAPFVVVNQDVDGYDFHSLYIRVLMWRVACSLIFHPKPKVETQNTLHDSRRLFPLNFLAFDFHSAFVILLGMAFTGILRGHG